MSRESLAPQQLEAVRRLYVETSTPNNVIGEQFGKAPNWVNNLATKYGWPVRKYQAVRAPTPKPPARRAHAHKVKTLKQIFAERRAQSAARERELYGNDVADIDLLRSCGFVVNREGAGVRVGNALCTFEQMREKAARERRLAKVMT